MFQNILELFHTEMLNLSWYYSKPWQKFQALVVLDTNKILKGHGFVILASTQLELSTYLMFVFQKFLMNPDSLVSKLPYVCGMLEYHKLILKCTHE